MSKLDRLEQLKEIVDQALPHLDLTDAQKRAVRERAAGHKTSNKKKYWWAAAVPALAAAIVCAVVLPATHRSSYESAVMMESIESAELVDLMAGYASPALGEPEKRPEVSASGNSHLDVDANSSQESLSATPEAQKTRPTAFQETTTSFSLELFRQSCNTKENSLLCPSSAALALGMTANGAAGNTLAQFQEVLGNGELSLAQLNEAYAEWLGQLESNEENAVLKVVNSIWLQNGFPVQQEFLRTNASFFHADAYQLDLQNPSAVQYMNEWVAERTNGKIEKLMEQVDPDTLMYLINTVYFDMEWEKAFDAKRNQPAEFHTTDGSSVTTDFMHDVDIYLKSDTAKGIKKAYQNKTYSFVAILPNEGISLEKYLSILTAEDFLALVNQEGDSAQYRLPKFRIEAEHSLNNPLQSMGLADAFQSMAADFSNLTFPSDGLELGKVVQKAAFSIHEKGTQAAAATYVSFPFESVAGAANNITFDRPFLFAVVDHDGVPIFLGTVADPTAS